MNIAVKVAARTLWVYSYVALALILAICAFPAVLWVVWAWDASAIAAWPEPLKWFWRTFSVTLGYMMFGVTMMLVLPILAKLLGWKTGEGTVPIRSFKVWNWYNYNGAILTFQTLFGKFTRSNHLYVLFLRAMGAKIGKHVIVNSNTVYDHDMLEIGDYTVIGGDAAIIGHVGEKGKLVREKIRIGKHCTIDQYTTVFPGVTIGDNCHVGAMSLVPKGAVLDSNAVYGGVPVRKIKDLTPADKDLYAQADAEALDIELDKSDDEDDERPVVQMT